MRRRSIERWRRWWETVGSKLPWSFTTPGAVFEGAPEARVPRGPMDPTPHSQRSSAEVRVKLTPSFSFPIIDLIDRIEDALKTPVQTAVKREDEQAFALLNGENLMFCEDAARRIQNALTEDERITDFWPAAAARPVAAATRRTP